MALYPASALYPAEELYPDGDLVLGPSGLGERLRERTQPLAPNDEAYGGAHRLLCAAIMSMLEEVGQLFDPPDPIPPAAPLVDPTLAPGWALPWVGQLVGVTVPPSATADQAREIIVGVSGWRRGTPSALRAAVIPFLTGSQMVWFRERDGGDPYALEVVTRTGETTDPEQVLAALLTQLPAGIVLRARTVEGWDYQALTDEGGDYTAQSAAYTSYSDLREGP